MAHTIITAEVDAHDKADFDAFCSNVGLNTSTAINLFVKAVLRENRIPFEITPAADPFFSQENLAYVKKSVQELRAGKGLPILADPGQENPETEQPTDSGH